MKRPQVKEPTIKYLMSYLLKFTTMVKNTNNGPKDTNNGRTKVTSYS